MDDHQIIERINQLVAEEHQLEEAHVGGPGLADADAARLKALEVQLDQAWDLLRQRRARRRAGLDPDAAEARDPNVVEKYWQ